MSSPGVCSHPQNPGGEERGCASVGGMTELVHSVVWSEGDSVTMMVVFGL